MVPFLFDFLPIPTFGLMVAMSFLVASICLERAFARLNLPVKDASNIIAIACVAGILGAKALYAASYPGRFVQIFLSREGFTFYGGFILAALCVWAYLRLKKLPISPVADEIGLLFALCYGIGRLGCQLSGDGDYGMATESILGMSYSTGMAPSLPGVLHYPTPLYESMMAFAVYFILRSLRERFSTFWLSIALMSVCRFFIEFIRIEPIQGFALTQAQLISIGLVVMALPMLRRKGEGSKNV